MNEAAPAHRKLPIGIQTFAKLREDDCYYVDKFSKVSLFSGLNNLSDITVDAAYSAICGYTEADLDTVFAPELAGLDRARIRPWYNGYNWTGEAVYNPFDVLLLFQKRQFRAWWFETGTPTFLIDLLTERQTWLPQLGQLETDLALLSAFDVGKIATEALLFQTGYLTIDREEEYFGEYRYRLRYPNQEVYQSLNNALLKVWTPNGQAMMRHKLRLGDLLLANDFAGMETLFTAFFASIPSDWIWRCASTSRFIYLNSKSWNWSRRVAPCNRSKTGAMPIPTAPPDCRFT
jgi:hypothetical protein